MKRPLINSGDSWFHLTVLISIAIIPTQALWMTQTSPGDNFKVTSSDKTQIYHPIKFQRIFIIPKKLSIKLHELNVLVLLQ
jgi:hypothetical protein